MTGGESIRRRPRNIGMTKFVHEARQRAREERLRRTDVEILTIEGVAELLHCSVQTARNIPTNELPRYDGPGRRLLYLREEVVRYVRSVQRINPAADELMRDIESEQLESPPDSGRRRRRGRRRRDDQSS